MHAQPKTQSKQQQPQQQTSSGCDVVRFAVNPCIHEWLGLNSWIPKKRVFGVFYSMSYECSDSINGCAPKKKTTTDHHRLWNRQIPIFIGISIIPGGFIDTFGQLTVCSKYCKIVEMHKTQLN